MSTTRTIRERRRERDRMSTTRRLSSRSARTRNVAESGGGAEMESCRRDPVARPRPPRARGGEQDARGDGRRDGGGGAGGSRARRRGVARGDAHSSRARARAARAEVQKMRSAAKAAAAKAAAAEAEIPRGRGRGGGRRRRGGGRQGRAAEHRVREAAASRIQAALRGRAARFEVSRRRVAAAAARAAAQAEVEERRARDAAATRIRPARARARRASSLKNGETPPGWPTRFATRAFSTPTLRAKPRGTLLRIEGWKVSRDEVLMNDG